MFSSTYSFSFEWAGIEHCQPTLLRTKKLLGISQFKLETIPISVMESATNEIEIDEILEFTLLGTNTLDIKESNKLMANIYII